MARLALFGTGGFGREVLPIARYHLQQHSHLSELVFVEDHPKRGEISGIPVITPERLDGADRIVVALGDSGARRMVVERLANTEPESLFAPTFICGEDVIIGAGSVFCHFTVVTGSARIGRHFQCNIYSYVAHDCLIGDYVTFAPRVSCNGNVVVRDGAYIGTGAVLKPGSQDRPLVVGEGAVIGMGAVVTKDVPANQVVVGNPARLIEL